MTTEAEDRAINQAKAARNSTKKGKGTATPKSVDNQSAVNNVQAVLDEARNKLKEGTKAYILGGIPDAIADIANGDFGEAGDNIMSIVGDFSASFGHLEDASLFQLAPASEPKKMLSANPDSDIADAVVIS